ncbi:phospholipase [Thermococcus sp. 21S7]|nr:phospholipase [Thermococcus sp. 21S7]
MEHLTYLNRTLREAEEGLSNVTKRYERCLVDLAVLGNSTTSLKNCRAELERTKGELKEREDEMRELRANLSRCNAQLETTLTGDLTVKLLTDEEYYKNVIDAINGAEKSIYVMMFSMLYDPDDGFDWANDLIRALVAAKNRGVEVHVLLEDGVESNREAYGYLRSHGVDVSFDSPGTTLHAKVVVIDGRLVFIGSHNWSESALYWNHEVSLMVASGELAERLIEYFEGIR